MNICAPRRAARTAAPRCAPVRADRNRRRAAPHSGAGRPRRARLERAIDRLHRRLDQRRAPARARRSSRRIGGGQRGHRRMVPPTASCASRRSLGDLLDLHHGGAALRRARSPRPAFGVSLLQFLDRRDADSRPRARRVRRGRDAPRPPPRPCAARVPERRQRGGVLSSPGVGIEQLPVRRGIDQRALVMLAVNFDQRRRRALSAPARSTGWSLTKARVRPSASCTRRRIISPASAMPLSLGSERAGCPGARSKAAVTCPCSAPWRTRPASPRPPSASANASSRMDLPAPVSPVSTDRPGRKVDVEPFDQNDVTDRQTRQHAR